MTKYDYDHHLWAYQVWEDGRDACHLMDEDKPQEGSFVINKVIRFPNILGMTYVVFITAADRSAALMIGRNLMDVEEAIDIEHRED